jgi:ubiquinone/menaquinone biosynthesis C-methylase UbiE
MSSEHRPKVIHQFTKVAEAFASTAGVVATHFVGKIRHATGIDLTPAMLGKARARQSAEGLSNITWDLGDV